MVPKSSDKPTVCTNCHFGVQDTHCNLDELQQQAKDRRGRGRPQKAQHT
ncbi:hypothetical protein PDIG_47820 [Penicillium digitatum PHI26]|uniref:Uncharacterized protein n=2 Tax=Penicillium digitatum TaxID=36651 RepID=K9GA37_PEND2|nr:hypothetical protein PDIP_57200 [Penicillium digitatum Pd1]EKV11135.1 hypothetical protein PDIP_57200 [Penicillium digitatum Pd1]EKV11768.1 hypothetical protein PDIG_47820 [Penicillium digitatum PHI26]